MQGCVGCVGCVGLCGVCGGHCIDASLGERPRVSFPVAVLTPMQMTMLGPHSISESQICMILSSGKTCAKHVLKEAPIRTQARPDFGHDNANTPGCHCQHGGTDGPSSVMRRWWKRASAGMHAGGSN